MANEYDIKRMLPSGKAKDDSVVVYQSSDGVVQLDVQLADETVWLTLNQLSILFDRNKSVISRHISNIYNEGELSREATVAKNATVQMRMAVRWCVRLNTITLMSSYSAIATTHSEK